MSDILVSGLINLEVTLQVDDFPIAYEPARYPFFGVNSSIAGVGLNVAAALTTLGDRVRLLSLVGCDAAGRMARERLAELGIRDEQVLERMAQTAHSVILYDRTGRRAIHVDLKDVQEQAYPLDSFDRALEGCALAVLCNVNFSRPLLRRALAAGAPVASDVHAIADLEDDYNRDFMAAARVLFASDERLPCPPREWVRRVWNRYGTEIVVVGLGAEGALLGVRSDRLVEHVGAVRTRPVVNTIGAGDALFSAFVHLYARGSDPLAALRRAVVFASYKIGAAGAADGFLDAAGLEALYRDVTEDDRCAG